MGTEQDFNKAMEKVPAHVRSEVRGHAWGNSFSVECHAEYENDEQRWEVAIFCVAMILDCPSDYGITL